MYKFRWRYTDKKERPAGCCYDCRMKYDEFPDLNLPDQLWETINPTTKAGAGLLCPTCIANRLNYLGLWYGLEIVPVELVEKPATLHHPNTTVPETIEITPITIFEVCGLKFDPSHPAIARLNKSKLKPTFINNAKNFARIDLESTNDQDDLVFRISYDRDTGKFYLIVVKEGREIYHAREETLEHCLTRWENYFLLKVLNHDHPLKNTSQTQPDNSAGEPVQKPADTHQPSETKLPERFCCAECLSESDNGNVQKTMGIIDPLTKIVSELKQDDFASQEDKKKLAQCLDWLRVKQVFLKGLREADLKFSASSIKRDDRNGGIVAYIEFAAAGGGKARIEYIAEGDFYLLEIMKNKRLILGITGDTLPECLGRLFVSSRIFTEVLVNNRFAPFVEVDGETNEPEKRHSHTDCRDEEGITVGLVDSIITAVRVLKEHDLTGEATKEALADLASDDDFQRLVWHVGGKLGPAWR